MSGTWILFWTSFIKRAVCWESGCEAAGMIEKILIGVVVAGAVVFSARRLYLWLKGEGTGCFGCGRRGRCPASKREAKCDKDESLCD